MIVIVEKHCTKEREVIYNDEGGVDRQYREGGQNLESVS
jgi:hypothetical protein